MRNELVSIRVEWTQIKPQEVYVYIEISLDNIFYPYATASISKITYNINEMRGNTALEK